MSIMWVESREWTKFGGIPFFCFITLGGLETSEVLVRWTRCRRVSIWRVGEEEVQAVISQLGN